MTSLDTAAVLLPGIRITANQISDGGVWHVHVHWRDGPMAGVGSNGSTLTETMELVGRRVLRVAVEQAKVKPASDNLWD